MSDELSRNPQNDPLLRQILKKVLGSIVEVSPDTADVLIDQFLDGLVRDVPLPQAVAGTVKIIGGIRDLIYLEKLWHFAQPLKDVPENKRRDFAEELERDPQKAGKHLALLVERQDSLEKCRLLGLLYKAVVCRELEWTMYLRMASAIERILLADLKDLKNISSGGCTAVSRETLYTAGLVRTENTIELPPAQWEPMYSSGYQTEVRFRVSALGEELLMVCKKYAPDFIYSAS
jgi:hypothetical protein